MKRLLDCDTSDLRQMNKEQILQTLQASEGRVIVQEISFFIRIDSCWSRSVMPKWPALLALI
ncbi:Uncharacterised protein [Faecalicoccus pleomorphus]|uniref:DUF7916 domain-containing protein n=1 Tax=Faecalicoccus pleomorphus TaxID=1323 RepID=A0A380LMG9_9FIRM|nr:hypothetical protein [Faecalicoccus pleomorphus]SUO04969.1 Uncharacterised protein [Faecalicoccus pleomorphus]